MEAVFAVLLLAGTVVWVWARVVKDAERPGAMPKPFPAPPAPRSIRPGLGVQPLLATRVEPPACLDDGAFFDGYIWGRLEERHDQQQHGAADSHDHDMFDGDDSCDDNG